MVKSNDGKGVDIDEEGRYRVRFDFYPGKDEYPRGYASPPLVLVQPYGNSLQANHPRAVGYHFPLHDGTYVYAQFLDGNLDRPIIGGTLYSPQQPSPCTRPNPWQNQYHTWGDNHFGMSDKYQQQQIEVYTREGKNLIRLSEHWDNHHIQVKSAIGDVRSFAKGQFNLFSGSDYTLTSNGKQHINVEQHQTIAVQGDITHQSASDIHLLAKRDLRYHTLSDLNTYSGRHIRTEVGNNYSLQVIEGDLSYHINAGGIDIQAASMAIESKGGGDVSFTTPGTNFNVTPAGDVNLKGERIIIDAPIINLKGVLNGQNGVSEQSSDALAKGPEELQQINPHSIAPIEPLETPSMPLAANSPSIEETQSGSPRNAPPGNDAAHSDNQVNTLSQDSEQGPIVLGKLSDAGQSHSAVLNCLAQSGVCTQPEQGPLIPLSALGLQLVAPTVEESLATDDQTNTASTGLSVAGQVAGWTGIGTSVYTAVNDRGALLNAAKRGRVMPNVSAGKQLVQLGAEGSQHIPPAATKASFLSTPKALSAVRGIGYGAGALSFYVSYKKHEAGEISDIKYAIDVVMTGIGFIPGWGWVASGLYFIIDEYVGWDKVLEVIESWLQVEERPSHFPDLDELPLAGIAAWQQQGFRLG